MKKKIQICLIVVIICLICAWFISITFFVIFALLAVLGISIVFFIFVANKLLKKTNWYKNIFVFTSQFVSNAQYRVDLNRNYDIINLGSNPARFAFFYENIKGQNWSTGTQGPDMDFEILKFNHSLLKDNGVVLIPIVTFSSLSAYLDKHSTTSFLEIDYYAKFFRILDSIQQNNFKNIKKIRRFISYPLLHNFRYIKYIVNDVEPDNRLSIAEQPMQFLDLKNDAQKWMKIWKDEFNLKNLNSPLDDVMLQCQNETIKKFERIVEFCLKRKYKPILVFPPISNALLECFTTNMRDIYVYPLTNTITKKYNIPFFDYLSDTRFADNSLFFNSLFMNLNGRKAFTKDVLSKIEVLYGCK